MVSRLPLFIVALAAFAAAGCGKSPTTQPTTQKQSSPSAAPPAAKKVIDDSPVTKVNDDNSSGRDNPYLPPPIRVPGSWSDRPSFGRSEVVEKRCGKCNAIVPNSSGPGMRCPHCGVRWDVETKRNSSPWGF